MRRGRARLHRTAPRRRARHGRQDGRPSRRGESGRAPRAGDRRSPSPTARRPRGSPRDIGYPVMIKAAMGGGGKGMRLVRAYARARGRAARRALGGGSGLRRRHRLHRAIHRGAAAHRDPGARRRATAPWCISGERECSIQRRHQKLVEESPSSFVDARHAAPDGRGGVPARRGGGLRQRGHRRVPRGSTSGTSTSSR